MKYKLKAYTFNDTFITPEVEIHLLEGETNTLLPKGIYEELSQKLKEMYGIESLSFGILSKEIEMLLSRDVRIDFQDLSEQLFKPLQKMIEAQASTSNLKNPKLEHALRLIEKRERETAIQLVDEIDPNTLSLWEFETYMMLRFKLTPSKTLFEQTKTVFAKNPLKIKELYFVYIKHLQDLRDEKTPLQLIEEFERHYPITILSQKEKAIYYYLKGRANYARGEFLVAIKSFAKALTHTPKDDEPFLASIYNTATNTFTDNLFFDEAEQLAKKAIEIRHKYGLLEEQASWSLLGGVYFKHCEFDKAFDAYSKSLSLLEHNDNTTNEQSRLLNYLAKTELMRGHFKKAKVYLDDSQKQEDKKGFLILLKFLYLYKTDAFDALYELYTTTLNLPENRKAYDNFVVGWEYALMAKMAFDLQKYSDGIQHLYRGIDYFLEDKYILEAFILSLYPFAYDIPTAGIEQFEGLIESFEIQNRIEIYMQKHEGIAQKYGELFGITVTNPPFLTDFYTQTKGISKETYNPEAVKTLIESVCLI